MRSYYSHLQSTKSIGEDILITQKPTFRSSAVFPVLHTKDYSTKILFMGYWLLKRQISEIGLLYTLRASDGTILSRKYLMINTVKAFSIDLSEFIDELKSKTNVDDFRGSLELEIFSTKDLVFPYPAFVLVYYNEGFSTAVHTVGRIYNDIEDLAANEEYKVREAGFDVYGNHRFSSFIAFTNGPIKNYCPLLKFKVINSDGKEFLREAELKKLSPYETVFLKLNESINLFEILGDRPGTVKVEHNFEGFFPRFVVGNFENESKSISITHSFYDSSELADSKSFWNRKNENFNDSSILVPLFLKNGYYTHLVLYPIFSPSDFAISFDFYDSGGQKVGNITNYEVIKSSENKYEIIDFNMITMDHRNLDTIASANIICNWENKEKIPTRLKFGLNIGKENSKVKLPSNICFAPQLGNPNILKKSGTFHWAPFINIGNSEVVFTNSAPLKDYKMEARIKAIFHRELDNNNIEREFNLPAFGIKRISISEDRELNSFLQDSSGWISANSDNPYIYGWYFDFHKNGSVAADHFF